MNETSHKTSVCRFRLVTPAVYPRLVEFLHFDNQSTGQKSHCVNTFSGHHNALFLLNSRIPLVRSSSELIVHRERRANSTFSSGFRLPESTCRSSQSPGQLGHQKRPPHPILRANPSPEVTDLFCRLPLSTLFQLARGC